MDGERFSLERAARALMEDSEGQVNAYKVWNISHNFSNSVTLVRLCHDSLTSGTQPEHNRKVTGVGACGRTCRNTRFPFFVGSPTHGPLEAPEDWW